MKLTKKDINKYIKKRNEFNEVKKVIDDRFGEIIKLIHKIFGNKSNEWWYTNASEGERGEAPLWIIEAMFKDKFCEEIEFEHRGCNNSCHTREYNFDDSINAYWLCWTDEEIEKFINDEIKKDEEKTCIKRKAYIKKKALKKLTQEERDVLGYGKY